MKKVLLLCLVVAVVLSFGSLASATDYGYGTGCSAIGGVLATDLVGDDNNSETPFAGDTFTGVLGTAAASIKADNDANSNGIPDSIDVCINDSLEGYCEFETGDITVTNYNCVNNSKGKCVQTSFLVTFKDVSTCAAPVY